MADITTEMTVKAQEFQTIRGMSSSRTWGSSPNPILDNIWMDEWVNEFQSIRGMSSSRTDSSPNPILDNKWMNERAPDYQRHEFIQNNPRKLKSFPKQPSFFRIQTRF